MTALDKLPSPGYIALAVACVGAFLFTGTLVSTIGITLILGMPLYFMSDLPPYATWTEKFGQYIFLLACTMIFIFLITPVLIIMPLSFNAEPYFSFTQGMMSLDPAAFSTRWYQDIMLFGMDWR